MKRRYDMKKKIITLLAAGLIAVMSVVPVMAETDTDKDTAGNIAVSGDLVTLPASPFFSAFAAGQSIDFGGVEASGSVFAAGQEISGTGAEICESLYVAGNTISLTNTNVLGNIFAAGNSFSMAGESTANAVYAVGNSISFDGITYALYAAGNTVTLKGKVDGDAYIEAENIVIGDDAVVTGTLHVKSVKEPEIPDGADIADYSYDKPEVEEDAKESFGIASLIGQRLLKTIYWIIAMAAFGMILCWLFNDHLKRASEYIKNRTASVIVSGILGWMCIPILAIAFVCTYFLAPIGGIALLAYVLLNCVGLAFAGASLTRLVLPKMNIFLSTLIGIAVLEAVRMIPVIGVLVGIAADMYLIGYVIQRLWLNRLKKN